MPRLPRKPQRPQKAAPASTKDVQTAISSSKLEKGLALLLQGRLQEAKAIYESVLAENPAHVDALHGLGVIAIQCGQYLSAVELIDKAIALQPDFAEAHNNRGQALKNLRRFEEALATYERAIELQPEFADAFSNRGVTLDILKRHDEALVSYERAIALKPDSAGAYINRGIALRKLERLDEALASYERAIALKPDYAEAWNNRGIVLGELGRVDEALASYERAVALKPDYADAYFNRGNALNALKRFDEALASFERAIALKPDHAEACNNRGNAFQSLKRYGEALTSFERAIALKPDHAEAYSNLGIALLNLKRIDEALASFERVIALKPNDPDACNNRGNALKNLNRLDEALASYERAIALKPDHAEAYGNRGNALKYLGRLDEALVSYEYAIALKPDFADAHNNRGNALKNLKRLGEALADYERAIALKPDYEFLPGQIAYLRMQLGDWSSLEQDLKALRDGLAAGEGVTHAFPMLALIDDPSLHRRAAEIFARSKAKPASLLSALPHPAPAARTHIAYLSADFHDHATAYLMAELFEGHDRNRFELTAVSFGPDKSDRMRQRVSAAFDRFIDARAMSDAEVARRCRELGVHIAIDLKGYTQDSRPGILAERCAPIQINYLGYPGTMAAPFIDYIVADRTLITEADLGDYSEKVIWLPDSYQVNDRQRPIADKAFTRAECGLPETGFVYCCFNNNYKITPATFDGWMRILALVPDSVLWLFEDNPWVVANLRREASRRGIAPERLIFAGRMPLPEHLARHRLADLFIDTLPYNAHTTASDALWAGLPVLTCMGRSFAARVAASLLKAVGLPELITTTQEDYENMAVALANDPERLAAIKTRLQDNRLTHPLFDSQRFTRNLERAFERVMERHWAGLEPEHMMIDEYGDSSSDPATGTSPVAFGKPSLPGRPASVTLARSAIPQGSLASLLGLETRIEIMDVGAACISEVPIYKRLLDQSIGHLHAFEGDERHIEKIQASYATAATVHTEFLFDGEMQTVYIASDASGMTSLLPPKQEALNFFNGFDKFGEVLRTARVQTIRLDDVPGLPLLDMVKMDIQGAELTVLKHGGDVLSQCVAIQLEVSYICLYQGQPTFGDVDVWMRSQGFVPHCFLDVKRWSIAPTIRNNNFRIPFNQLLESDIVYVRDPLKCQEWTGEQLRKLAVIAHECMGSTDLAVYLMRELERRDDKCKDLPARFLALVSAATPTQ